MKPADRVFVAGHRGLVGSAITRYLQGMGFRNILTRTRAELDLEDRDGVHRFFEDARPEYVFLAAAKVGGILANSTYPGDFIRSNLAIQTNVMESARQTGVKRLVFLGSSCIYPKHAPQPIKEEHLLSGYLEPTNQAYAIAKIAGVEMVRAYNEQYGTDFVSVMPTNLYGPVDNFDLQTSHVLPALLRKFHEAKVAGAPTVVVWGTGTPRREFLHVDDLAAGCVFLMQHQDPPALVNVGYGSDLSIAELAELIKDVTGYEGTIEYDRSKPDGTPRKLLDVSRMAALGWKPRIALREGVTALYTTFLESALTRA
jgi:GDP-L-fucose synthase